MDVGKSISHYMAKSGQSNKHKLIRDHARQVTKSWSSVCSNPDCGYTSYVETCHRQAISSFPPSATLGQVNDPSNLMLLCPNCHHEFDAGRLVIDDEIQHFGDNDWILGS
jgi:5-methylcytosine-specific restriction endonuclease McrA